MTCPHQAVVPAVFVRLLPFARPVDLRFSAVADLLCLPLVYLRLFRLAVLVVGIRHPLYLLVFAHGFSLLRPQYIYRLII